MKAVALKRY